MVVSSSSIEDGASLVSPACGVGWMVTAPLALALTLLWSRCWDLVPAPPAPLLPGLGEMPLDEHQCEKEGGNAGTGQLWRTGGITCVPSRDQLRLLQVSHPGVAQLDLGLQQ